MKRSSDRPAGALRHCDSPGHGRAGKRAEERRDRRAGWRAAAALAAALGCATGPATPGHAVEESGGAPGEWLSRYSGARSIGLGSAFVAAADAPLGVVWNPAALGVLYQNEVLLETARLFEDTALHGFGFAVPGRRLPSLGLSVVALRSGEFEKTNELNESLGSFEDGETAFLFSAAKNFSTRFALGCNLKLVHQSVEEWSASGFGADLGGMLNVTPAFRLGMSILNVGGPELVLRETAEKYPTELRGGFALRLLGGRGLVSAEIDHKANVSPRLHAGTEYWIQPGVALRVGYDESHASGGFSCRVTPQTQLDYGVADHALGLTHRLGFTYRFGGFFAAARAVPEVFSPSGEQSVTKIELRSHTRADADRWALRIIDKSDTVVRQFGGPGQPPAHLLWDGKDEAGLPLPDGVYRYQLTVNDREGREMPATVRSLEITTSGPQGAVPVILQ